MRCVATLAVRAAAYESWVDVLIESIHAQDGERFWKLPEAYIRGNNVSRSSVRGRQCAVPDGRS